MSRDGRDKFIGTEIDSIIISDEEELRFQILEVGRNVYGDIRIFLNSEKYVGYTQHGISSRPRHLKYLKKVLLNCTEAALVGIECELGYIDKNRETTIIVSLKESDYSDCPVDIDVRQYVKSENFEGFTRKGYRIPVAYLGDFIKALDKLSKALDEVLEEKDAASLKMTGFSGPGVKAPLVDSELLGEIAKREQEYIKKSKMFKHEDPLHDH